MNEDTNSRTQDFRVRQNLGIPQPVYRIRTIGDLIDVPDDRRAMLCQALFAWLIDPNRPAPKKSWLSLHFWIGQALPEFVWEDDGKLPTAKVIATLRIDATEAIATIRRAIVNLVEQKALPESVLEAFDKAQQQAAKPQQDADREERAEKAIAALVGEYGLRVQNAGDGATWYTAQPKFGSLKTDQMVTTIHKAKPSQMLEHLENWLRHHIKELDTVSALRRQLRAVPPGWIVQWVADVAGTTVGVWRLFQPVPSAEADHPAHSLALGNSETGEFEALRIALGMFIDTKTLESCRLRFGNGLPPFAGFPGLNEAAGKAPDVLPRTMGIESNDPDPLAQYMYGWTTGAAGYDRPLSTNEHRVRGHQHGYSARQHAESLAAWAISDQQKNPLPGDQEANRWPEGTESLMLPPLVGHDGAAWPGTMDAVCWAEAWKRRFALIPGLPHDEGTMLGWFANAIMAGYDTATRRAAQGTAEAVAGEKAPLQKLRDVFAVQGSDGNWNYSEYLLGMFNGMELAMAIFEAREPVYRKKPEGGYLEDRKRGAGKNATTVPDSLQAQEGHDAQPPLLPETATMDATDLPPPDGHTPAVEPPADTKGHEAIQALEKANPAAPGLIGKDAPRVYVHLSELLGQFARYAVSQSPYLHPDGLLEVLDAIRGDVGERFDPVFGWAELNFREVEAMLNEAIMALPQVSAWNQRKNGNTSEFAFASRMPQKRDPDNDFIDLQALITNVALACTRDAGALRMLNAPAGTQPPQPVDGESGLWRYAEGDGLSKYLVLRRDGSVPTWPYFIMGARDEAAIQAVAAYAWYASLLKYPPQFVADVERLAREMAVYRQDNGAGNPTAPPDRHGLVDGADHPAILTLLRAHGRGESCRIQEAANWIPEEGEA